MKEKRRDYTMTIIKKTLSIIFWSFVGAILLGAAIMALGIYAM